MAAAYNPLLQQIKIYELQPKVMAEGLGLPKPSARRRKTSANKILANNRIIIPKGFAFGSGQRQLWHYVACPGDTHTHAHTHTICNLCATTLRIRNATRYALRKHFHCGLLRYFVAVNNAAALLAS